MVNVSILVRVFCDSSTLLGVAEFDEESRALTAACVSRDTEVGEFEEKLLLILEEYGFTPIELRVTSLLLDRVLIVV